MKITDKFFSWILVLVVLTFLAVLSPSTLNAEKVQKVIEGLIENVTRDSIQVKGKYFNTYEALITNNAGREVSKDELKRDRHVLIFNQGNKTIIMIDMME